MDLTKYYQKVRDEEAKIAEEFPIVVSLETPDGGKAGKRTETAKRLAAKLVAEGLARLATKGEAEAFRGLAAEARRAAERLAQAAKLQLTVLASHELEKLRSAATPKE